MKLSKTSAQAALAMAYLVGRGRETGPIQARQVGDHLGIPTDSALKILQALARRNLINSQLGRTGGYQCDDSGRSRTLLEVVEAIDGPLSGSRTALNKSTRDELTGSVNILEEACRQATIRFREELSKYKVADLVDCRHLDMATSHACSV